MPKNKVFYTAVSVFIFSYYLLLVFYWTLINISKSVGKVDNYIFVLLITLIPVIGFITGIKVSEDYNFYRKPIGRAFMLWAFGLLFWGVANAVYFYLDITSLSPESIPYPSIADYFYISVYLFYFLSIYSLRNLKKISSTDLFYNLKGVLIFFACVLVLAGYAGVFKVLIWGLDLSFYLDYIYLLLDFFLVLAVLYTFFVSKSSHLAMILILGGVVIEAIADISYSLSVSSSTFVSGNWVDLLFLTSITLLSVSVPLFASKIKV